MDALVKRYGFHVAESSPKVPLHPTESRELLYGRTIINAIRLTLKAQDVQVFVFGQENLPTTGGALLAINHTGYYDFILGGIPAYTHGKRLVRFMAKKEIFDTPIVGALMRGMKHVSVNRAAGSGSMEDARKRLDDGGLVGIFPEATVSRSFEIKELKTGAVRIAEDAQVPLLPVIIWGGQRIITKDTKRDLGRSHIPVFVSVGTPVDSSGDPEEATARLYEAMKELLDETRTAYEQKFGPFEGGELWRPVSLGGGAPTLEQAKTLEIAERERRQAKREAKKAAKKRPSLIKKLFKK
ncbi:lysophospholipid acyltransferase family protein [Corynebacterium crudilactis]|uniref:Acyl-phosphate glycerol 3-phosphate acyltransferase n=1 Tax=Corynebacterium crudilactis TaxID=1652495 RepID=A0A172QWG1_9CORY|nr:1-acyl-sn-glycerol-3-phosphate acyltransferase [Corynebacterium crudilactis]ANE05054.1 acyl-phosphate glycerol 3-phosphate acyltransferase [Corynebacterium crudilactis]